MAREELVVSARQGLALVPELFSELPASWWPVAAASSDVAGDPAARAAGPCLGCQPCHVGLPHVGSVDGVCRVLCCLLGVEVGHLIAPHAQEGGDPPDRDRISSTHEPITGLDGLYCETLSRARPVRGNSVYCGGGVGENGITLVG